jgi:nucleotide-binding universal stress UspA family protein
MLGFNRILLATDFSAGATAALPYAAALARLSHATLQILHVIDTRVTALSRWTDILHGPEVFAARAVQETAALQELLAHPALAGLPVEQCVRQGHPADRIIDLAANVDLVVMGGQGTTPASDRAIGKVAQQVAHSSPVPALLVPASAKVSKTSAMLPLTLPVQHILLALHVVEYAPQAITLCRALATVCQASLTVLQILEPATSFRLSSLGSGTGLSHNLESTKALLRKRLEEIMPDMPTGPAIERLVVRGNPAQAIPQQIKERNADLVVMSVHAYEGLKKLFVSSIVDAVLAQTPCPLLAVPFPPTL